DHLGTPRRVTDSAGNLLYQHDYLPYGEEVTDSGQNQFPLKYTGHERDLGYTGTLDDLDYMHARYYSPFLGRFGRVDPLRGSPAAPQSLNRYAYVMGNPINLVDPFGLRPNKEEGDLETFREYRLVLDAFWRFAYWSYNSAANFGFGPGGLSMKRGAERRGPVFGGIFGRVDPEVVDPTPETPGEGGSGAGDSNESGTEGGGEDDPEVLEMVSEVFCSAIYNWTGAVLVEGGEFWGGYASLVSTPARAEATFGGPIATYGAAGGVYPVGLGTGGAEGLGLTFSGVLGLGAGRTTYFSYTLSTGGSTLVGGIGVGIGGGFALTFSPSWTFVVSDLCD
ncbi:MAG: RHS repeat-associated core domain-containing protein, partial [Thermoanaerobaculia bacterium]